MKTKELPVKVIQKENAEPIAVEVIAQSIKKISDTMEQINKSKLSNRAIRVLLRDASGESMKSIENILGGLSNLRKYYLKD